MAPATNELSVIQRTYDLLVWLLPRLESRARRRRFTLECSSAEIG